jgi:hypothetical protein
MQYYENHKYLNICKFPFLKLKFRANNFYKLVKKNGDSHLVKSDAAFLDEWLLIFLRHRVEQEECQNRLHRGDI